MVNNFLKFFQPKPKQTISQWADKYRYLSKVSSSEAGKWRTSRAEYQRGIMDAFNEHGINKVVVMSSSQIGKTSILENIIGYYVHYEPSPILILQPTLEMAQTFSKDRLMPMFKDTPVLKDIVGDLKSRKSNSTILHKVFPGGHITMAGANSPASLASRPIKILLCDEVDRYPATAGVEGDPVNLAIKRTTTFWDKKIFLCSTPTIKGASRIETAYEESDQRKFYVPCPFCGEFQILEWGYVRWKEKNPKTAVYQCKSCKKEWNDAKRYNAISKGKWISEEDTKNIAGFWINELYSPWVALEKIVSDFLEAKKDANRLQVWTNTSMGETWEEEGEIIEDHVLFERTEDYEEVPEGVLILTAGVDVQEDRIEIDVVGWGHGEESWGIEHKIFYGNPEKSDVWSHLDMYLSSSFPHSRGMNLKISCCCIDSGYKTKAVYDYVRDKEARHIYAIKGANTAGAPTVARPSRNNQGKVLLFTLGTDTLKKTIFARMKIQEKGPGYMHFNKSYDNEYFRQLTAEKLIRRYKNGFPVYVWKKIRERNEALDLRVYALAALEILKPNFEALEKFFEKYKDHENGINKANLSKNNKKSWLKRRNNWIK